MARSYLVLRLEPTGESFLKIHLLNPETGLELCLKRISRKQASAHPGPDLFDTADIRLERSKQGTLRFVADYHPVLRRTAIGQDYRRLQRASALCQILVQNAAHLPDLESLYQLANRSLDAFCELKSPAVVYLKSLYLLLKEEGFPVREAWWPQLPGSLREASKTMIEHPSPPSLSKSEQAVCEQAIDRLHLWIRRETELILPNETTRL